jgi:broad specificity phosphatase PhoE
MTQATAAVLAEALRLDEQARAELAAELLGSLDGPADPNAEVEWAREIEGRVASIESGNAILEPWDRVKHRIERDILGR